MKKSYICIALAMVAALSMVFCACTSKLNQEEIKKTVLDDSVLAKLDSLADEYITAHENGFHFRNFELTKQEKSVKPDYLLDPSKADSLVTKSQKINALAIYIIDLGVRDIYDMPTEQAREAIAKLVADLNYPYDIDQRDSNMSKSERRKQEYNKCKENGNLACFWQFQNAVMCETGYILSQDSELFFSKISEEQWQAFVNKTNKIVMATMKLAKYDEEMAAICDMLTQNSAFQSDEEKEIADTSIVTAKQFSIANKDKFIAARNALLQ